MKPGKVIFCAMAPRHRTFALDVTKTTKCLACGKPWTEHKSIESAA